SSQIRFPDDRRNLAIRPASGTDNDWKPVAYPKVEGWVAGRFAAGLTPDGDWLLYRDRDAGGKDRLYRVSTSGGEPEPIGDYPTSQQDRRPLSISSDGHQIIVTALESTGHPELWILENLGPAAAPKPTKK